MLTIEVDQYEFPGGANSEQFARISIHRKGMVAYATIIDFARAANKGMPIAALPAPRPFFEIWQADMARRYLEQFARLVLPAHCSYPTYLIADDWNECHMVIEGHEVFINYYWATSA